MTVILVGILCRGFYLDLKPYWFDEAATSLYLSGYGERARDRLTTGQIIQVADLQAFQYPRPDTTVVDTIQQLADKEPELSPLYFALTRLWVEQWGNTIASIRSLSAVFSVLALPALYWLCRELFVTPVTGWVAIALFAVSPFQVMYAQEARPTSLWTLAILISSTCLLRAMRTRHWCDWLTYAVMISLSLYSYLLSILVILAQGLYVLAIEKGRFNSTLRKYLFALSFGVISFAPWIATNLIPKWMQSDGNHWHREPISTLHLALSWFKNWGRYFIDFNLTADSPVLFVGLWFGAIATLISLTVYAFSVLVQKTPRQSRLFLLSLTLFPMLPLVVQDLLTGGIRSTVLRYMIPTGIGLQLAVAYLFAEKITSVTAHRPRWKQGLLLLLSASLISACVMVQSPLWWHKDRANINSQLGQWISNHDRPLILSDVYFVEMLSLSHSLAPHVSVQLFPETTAPNTIATHAQSFSDRFVYRPSLRWLEQLQKSYHLQPIYPPVLWQLRDRSIESPPSSPINLS